MPPLTLCPCCAAHVVGLGSARDKRTGDFLISGCATCGLIFGNPPPPPEEIESHYREGGSWREKIERRKELAESQADLPHKGVLHRAMQAEAAKLYQAGKRRVLDFGCGDGKLLDTLQDAGWETFGTDPATASEITRHTMLEEMPTVPSFDLVVLKNVLEHMIDPVGALRSVRKCLMDDGTVFVSTPTLDNLHLHGKKKYCLNRTHHVTAYTSRSLVHMLSFVGLWMSGVLASGVAFRMALIARPGEGVRDADPLADAQRFLSLADQSA